MDDNDDFSFEIEDETPVSEADKPEIEIEDDTPEADRGREPMPKELVEELEADELEEYSDKVKTRLKQMKKVWHDERREKEREMREKTEALSVAQRILEENRRLKSSLAQGEQSLLGSYKQTAEFELSEARRAYKDAYEAGDTDRVLEAQEKLSQVNYRMQQINNYRPSLQEEYNEVEIPQQQAQIPQPDQKTMAWQERNTWYGTDPEMTATALGLHQRLINERGPQFAGTDEYWGVVDKTMRRRFSDYFGDEMDNGDTRPNAREQKASSVVAPASRTRSPKKIVLNKTQVSIAKRLGLTNEQYAREVVKMEK
jgi:Spy/CpxP family protein refolding chaperone